MNLEPQISDAQEHSYPLPSSWASKICGSKLITLDLINHVNL